MPVQPHSSLYQSFWARSRPEVFGLWALSRPTISRSLWPHDAIRNLRQRNQLNESCLNTEILSDPAIFTHTALSRSGLHAYNKPRELLVNYLQA